jgi:hypothetical protein
VYNKANGDFANNHGFSDLCSPTGTYCDNHKIGYITAWVEAHRSTGTPFDMTLLTVNRTGRTRTILIVAVPVLALLITIDITNVDRCTRCLGFFYTPIGWNSYAISTILVCRESTTCRSVLLVLYLSLLKTRTIVSGLSLIAIRQSWTTHL